MCNITMPRLYDGPIFIEYGKIFTAVPLFLDCLCIKIYNL